MLVRRSPPKTHSRAIDSERLQELFLAQQQWCRDNNPVAVAVLFNAVVRYEAGAKRFIAVIVEVTNKVKRSAGCTRSWRDAFLAPRRPGRPSAIWTVTVFFARPPSVESKPDDDAN